MIPSTHAARWLSPGSLRKLLMASIPLVVAVTVLLPGGVRAHAGEPTDPPNAFCLDAEDLGLIASFPLEIGGSLEDDTPSTRVDFYRLDAEPGSTLRADMTDQATEPTTMANPLLGLFDSACRLLDVNDDLVAPGIDSLDARLAITVPDDGIVVIAAAASPDTGFDGSSNDIGTYTLWLDRDPPEPLAPIAVTIARGDDDRIEVLLPEDVSASGYNVYRDGSYITTVRPPDGAASFALDGIAGDYCIVAFREVLDETRYSTCSESFAIGPDGVEAGPPETPQRLRAMVYSRGVAELFWDPAIDDGRIVTYRVFRDGIEVANRDAGSHFESALEPARTYRYKVIAVDNDGNEGPPARLELRALFGGPVPPEVGDGLAPAAPEALRGVTYSPGVVEIFWDRSADHTRLAGYEVRRNGERVAFHKGASHFEPQLSAERAYDFEVVAVDADGNRSEARRLQIAAGRFTVPGEPSPTAQITLETYTELVAHAFDVYVGDLYNAPLLALEGLDERMAELRISRDASDNPYRDVFACGDGRAELALTFTGTDAGNTYDWLFDACRHDDLLYDGPLILRVGARESVLRSTGLNVRADDAPFLEFAGLAVGTTNSPSVTGFSGSWSTTNSTLTAITDEGELSLENATSVFSYGFDVAGDFRARLEGTFAVRSEASGDTLLYASTPVAFGYERASDAPDHAGEGWDFEDWDFTSGQLELVAADGSSLRLDADTGDAETVRVTIDNESGTRTFSTAWTPWRQRLRFDRDPSLTSTAAPASPW